MLHRSVVKFPLALLLSLSSLASIAQSPKPESQQTDAKKPSSGRANPSDGITHAALGQSLFALIGPWKFSIGDSPIDPATQRPLWAEPGFDDSHWEDVDLTAPVGALSGPSRVLVVS